jgi:hypothetical protein
MINHFLFDDCCCCCRFFLGCGAPYDCMSKSCMLRGMQEHACLFIGIVHCNFNILKIHEV